MNATTASKLDFKLKFGGYFQRKDLYFQHHTQEGPILSEHWLFCKVSQPSTLSLTYTELALAQPHHVCIFMLLHMHLCEFATYCEDIAQ